MNERISVVMELGRNESTALSLRTFSVLFGVHGLTKKLLSVTRPNQKQHTEVFGSAGQSVPANTNAHCGLLRRDQ